MTGKGSLLQLFRQTTFLDKGYRNYETCLRSTKLACETCPPPPPHRSLRTWCGGRRSPSCSVTTASRATASTCCKLSPPRARGATASTTRSAWLTTRATALPTSTTSGTAWWGSSSKRSPTSRPPAIYFFGVAESGPPNFRSINLGLGSVYGV